MKKTEKNLISALVAGVIAGAPFSANATIGMNLEGYGPISLGMGGVSMAIDNGNAAMMNNPATLSMMPTEARFDIALGFLGPDVSSSVNTPMGKMTAKSSGDAYYMPALGYARRSGKLTYGFGAFAQGGMGTDYSPNSFMSAGSGLETRSELSVGRALIPLTYDVNDRLTVGGSLDFVWAGMDLMMAMNGDQMMDFMPSMLNPRASNSMGSVSGSMVMGLGGMMQAGMLTGINWVHVGFSDDSDYTGEAMGTGWGGKLGVTYKVNDRFTLGATYHTETNIDDLETSHGTMTMNVNTPRGAQTMPVSGSVDIIDFQWPSTFGLGGAYKVSDQFTLGVDMRHIRWSRVMDSFRMRFTANNSISNQMMGFAGSSMEMTMQQNWDDQTALQIGGQYAVNDQLRLRMGFSVTDNPIPDEHMNSLFPAIIEKHLHMGGSYDINDNSTITFAYSHALESSQTNSNPLTGNVHVDHDQDSWQLCYDYRF